MPRGRWRYGRRTPMPPSFGAWCIGNRAGRAKPRRSSMKPPTADPRDPMPHLWMGMILGQQIALCRGEAALRGGALEEPAARRRVNRRGRHLCRHRRLRASGGGAQARGAGRAQQSQAAGRARSHPRRARHHDEGRRRDPPSLRNRVRTVTEHRHFARLYRRPPRHRGSKKSPRRAALTSSIAQATRSATRCPRSWAAAPPSSTWMAIGTSTSCSCKAAAWPRRPARRQATAVSQPRRRRLR